MLFGHYYSIIGIFYAHTCTAFGQAKSDGQSVASRQQALTATYERLVQAAEVYTHKMFICWLLYIRCFSFKRSANLEPNYDQQI